MPQSVDWALVKVFLERFDELKSNGDLTGRPDEEELRPVVAMMLTLGERIERLATRTEVECKKEIYQALGKKVPATKALLRQA